MDTIRFVIEDYVDEENGFRFPTVNIYINDQNLIGLVGQVEQRYRVGLNWDSFRQSYVGLHLVYYDFRAEFLGYVRRPYSILLTCTCLMPECNCITARITMDSGAVVWRELESPILGSEASTSWIAVEGADTTEGYPIDYSGLGPFVFDRSQYVGALEMLVGSM